MPTTRPRHFVTETDDLEEALNSAAETWPGLTRAQLLVRLALEGDRSVQRAVEERRHRRRTALDKHSGILSGAYGADHRDALRDEWPT